MVKFPGEFTDQYLEFFERKNLGSNGYLSQVYSLFDRERIFGSGTYKIEGSFRVSLEASSKLTISTVRPREFTG